MPRSYLLAPMGQLPPSMNAAGDYQDESAVDLPSYSPRLPITIETCASAFVKLDRDHRDMWTHPCYEWIGWNGKPTIILKADKLPQGSGGRFETYRIYESAREVLNGFVDSVKGGLGGSVGLETQAEGLEAGEWRFGALGIRGAR